MFSNLKIKAEKLEYDLNKPFDLMVNKATYQEWLRLVYIFRTDRKEEVVNFGLAQVGNIGI